MFYRSLFLILFLFHHKTSTLGLNRLKFPITVGSSNELDKTVSSAWSGGGELAGGTLVIKKADKEGSSYGISDLVDHKNWSKSGSLRWSEKIVSDSDYVRVFHVDETTVNIDPACNDGIQNGNETGIDCGGSSCEPCEPSTGSGIAIWKQLVSKEEFPVSGINYSPYTFDRDRRVIYILKASESKLYRYHIDSNSFDAVGITNFPSSAEDGGVTIYNPSRNTFQFWRPGPDKVYEVSVDGGSVVQIGPGNYSSAYYGSNPMYNGVTHNPLFMFGYGWYTYKNSVYELNNGNWVLRRDNNEEQPYKRGTHIYPNGDYTKALIIDGAGNASGNQLESSCSLPGGMPWGSDVGYWCWLRDIWEIDLATMEVREVLPVNSDFGATGSFGYDYEHDDFYSFGGFVPPTVKNGSFIWEDTLRIFDPSNSTGWVVLEQGGEIMPPDHSISYYDAEKDRFIVFSRSGGIYEVKLPVENVEEECLLEVKSSVFGEVKSICGVSEQPLLIDPLLGEVDTLYSVYSDMYVDSQEVVICLDHPLGIDNSSLYELELHVGNTVFTGGSDLYSIGGGDWIKVDSVYSHDGGSTYETEYTEGAQRCRQLVFYFDGNGDNGILGESDSISGSNYLLITSKLIPDSEEIGLEIDSISVDRGELFCGIPQVVPI